MLLNKLMNLQKDTIQRLIYYLLVLLCISSFILSAILINSYLSYKKKMVNTARAHVTDLTKKAVKDIETTLKEVMKTVDSTADDITEGRLKKHEILDALKKISESHPNFYTLAISYKPYGYDSKRRLFSELYTRKTGTIAYVRLDQLYDYTKPEYAWYNEPMEKGRMWSQPFFAQASEKLLVTYSAPFYDINQSSVKERTPLGIITAGISMDEIKKIIQSLDLGPSGFGGLISKKGVYLYHPVNEYVKNQKTIFDVARELNDKDRIKAGESAIKGESGFMEHKSTSTGLSSWFIYEPVALTGWSLQNTFIKNDIPLDIDLLRHSNIKIALALMIFILTFLALMLQAYKGEHLRLWILSAAVSVLLMAGIGYMWHLALTVGNHKKAVGVKITDRVSLSNFKNSYSKRCAGIHEIPPVYLPTGIFIRSLEFAGSNKIKASGYIWQRFDETLHKDLTGGFVLPDAVDIKISEAYTWKEKDTKVTGWDFQGIFFQNLDYVTYPVDSEQLLIRMNYRELEKNVVLVPDLESYKFLNPTSFPGLEKTVVLPGWKTEKTLFSLMEISHDTDFGIKNYSGQEKFPELHFNIMIQRNVIDAFIQSMTPLIVAAFLMYLVILIMSKDPKRSNLSLAVGQTLAFSGSLFFVIILSHINLRSRITAQDIFYLEYFYFIMYFALLWTSVSSILFGADKLHILHYKDNFVSKALFWPVTLGYLFVVTVMVFY